ncbi:hypothetical protein B6F84_02135 [Acidianus manzaensis]|uniref:MobA-like NTP transferase domain-containing protein n=2 Tax=Acidianus manzaensis TaxID=282676 RepID=A0A1W6JXF0_9CREN|nr:hypothetical protein B6F84_02135 [Acidianus manzaensis]
MAGGKGSRLGTSYKPVINICGKPMILWIYDTIRQIVYERNIYIATLRIHNLLPILYKFFSERNFVFTSGIGYEYDILEAVRRVGFPVIVLPSDTPFVSLEDLLYLIFSCKSAICNLITKSKYVGISFWQSLNINDYSNIESRKEIINVNTEEDIITAINQCKRGNFEKNSNTLPI